MLFKLSSIALMITIMCQNVPVLFRISYYFMLPFYALISELIAKKTKGIDRFLIYAIIISIMSLQYVVLTPGAGITDYYFYWN